MVDHGVQGTKWNKPLSREGGIGRKFPNHIRAQHQFFVAPAAVAVIAVHGDIFLAGYKAGTDDGTAERGIQAQKTGIALVLDLLPGVKDDLYGVGGQGVVGIDADVQLCVDLFIGGVVGGVHAAVFFVNISNLKTVILCLPLLYQLGGIVRRTVVHDQPDEVSIFLTFHAFVGPGQGVSPVVGRGENGQKRLAHRISPFR